MINLLGVYAANGEVKREILEIDEVDFDMTLMIYATEKDRMFFENVIRMNIDKFNVENLIPLFKRLVEHKIYLMSLTDFCKRVIVESEMIKA